MYRGTTIGFLVSGANFEPGSGATLVYFNKTGSAGLGTTISFSNASMVQGTVTIPSVLTTGPWNVVVGTINAGNSTRVNAVTIL